MGGWEGKAPHPTPSRSSSIQFADTIHPSVMTEASTVDRKSVADVLPTNGTCQKTTKKAENAEGEKEKEDGTEKKDEKGGGGGGR